MFPRRSYFQLLAAWLVLWLTNGVLCFAQHNGTSAPRNQASSAQGRNVFNSSCAGCHGLDGRGSDKAVNISTTARIRHLSDAELSGIILNGLPGTGMPAFHTLSAGQVHAVVAYLRSLQGKTHPRSLPGDPKRGKDVFFGKGQCGNCHTVSGQGGFLGPDLSAYGSSASAEAIRDEIVRSQRIPARGYRRAAVVTGDGIRLEGLVRNEDNFSVQLQTADGGFHFFQKSELRSFDRVEPSLMPTNYSERLGAGELNDLVSFLLAASPDGTKAPPRKREDDVE
jgi:putative heme-binding domain-containing protein